MTAKKVLLTPIANIKELISTINPHYMPELSSVRSLLINSLVSTAIESIYRDLYSEPKMNYIKTWLFKRENSNSKSGK